MNAPDKMAAFHAERMEGLGGSDIGAILGLSKYRTPVDVWAEKTGRVPPQESNLQMRFGTFAEEFVAQEYSAATGLKVQRFNPMLRHPTAPLIGHVDRLVVPEGQKVASHKSEIRTDRLLECKTANAFAAFNAEEWGEAGTDNVPTAYLVQVATYRILTGCQYADLAVLFGNHDLRIYHLLRDVELEQMIIAKASEWWQRHIVADVAPEPVCDADVKLLYPKSVAAKTIEANEELLHKLAVMREARAQMANYEAIADAAALSIKTSLGDADALVWQGETLATWKSAKPGSKTDWKAVANALDAPKEVIDQFTTETAGSRRFLMKD